MPRSRPANLTRFWGRAKTPCRGWFPPAGRGLSWAELRRPEPAPGEVPIDLASPLGQRRAPDEYWRRTGNFGFVYAAWVAFREWGHDWSAEAYGNLVRLWQAGLLALTAAVATLLTKRLVVGGATLLCAHFLVYHQVWEHHYSAVVPLGLLILGGLSRGDEGEGGGAAGRLGFGLGWAALVVVALPTPFALWHANDPTWRSWPGHQRWILSLSKALPLLVTYGVGVMELIRGVRWPKIHPHDPPDPRSGEAARD